MEIRKVIGAEPFDSQRKKRTSYGRKVAGRRISAEGHADSICRGASRGCVSTADSEHRPLRWGYTWE